MSLFTIFLLWLSVSADAFAVAVASSLSQKKVLFKQALSMGIAFWLFQGLMPILGFYLASFFTVIIMDYDHWIAFILLGYIGINMIQEGLSQSDEKMDKNIFTFRSLLFLSIATSIDALAVGISLTASTDNIYFPALIIAIITGILSFIGVRFWPRIWSKIWSRSEIIGGLILIWIGAKILADHLGI